MPHILAKQVSKQFWTTEEVRRDMWRGPANEQTKNKEAATRCDMDLLIIEERQVNSCPNRSQNMQMQYFCYTHYELFASKCILFLSSMMISIFRSKKTEGLALTTIPWGKRRIGDKME